MKKAMLVMSAVVLLLTGCANAKGSVQSKVDSGEEIGSGLTPEDVVRLYLTLNGKGSYVLAYDLLTSEQKREETVEDVKKYSKLGVAELERIVGVQEEGDLSLVTAAVRYTDEETQEVKYRIEEFVLAKEEEWRLTDQSLLDKGQLESLKGMAVQQANAIKNSPETKAFIADLKRKNEELASAAKVELFEQANNLQQELDGFVNNHKDDIKKGTKETLNSVKNGIENGAEGLKSSLFGN